MALFCFWTRRACSRFAVLGQPLPPGSKIEAHIAQCSACREYWSDLRMLTTDLDQLVHVPRPSPQFAEPIWERVKPTSRAVPWGRLSLAAAAMCGLACGLVWWRFASLAAERPPNGGIVQFPVKHAPADALQPQVWPEIGPLPRPDQSGPVVVKAPAPRHHHSLKWSQVRNGSRSRQIARRSPHRLPDADSLRRSNAAARLRASGLAYESQGDPGLANVAYQAAYQQHPSEDTAYDMGRSAEESGDIEQALNVYAGLLESADARTQAQKGWTP